MEGYLYDMAQIFFVVGVKDPFLDDLVKINLCLLWKLNAYPWYDPPNNVHPIPISLLRE